jgi:hypothetical protein
VGIVLFGSSIENLRNRISATADVDRKLSDKVVNRIGILGMVDSVVDICQNLQETLEISTSVAKLRIEIHT